MYKRNQSKLLSILLPACLTAALLPGGAQAFNGGASMNYVLSEDGTIDATQDIGPPGTTMVYRWQFDINNEYMPSDESLWAKGCHLGVNAKDSWASPLKPDYQKIPLPTPQGAVIFKMPEHSMNIVLVCGNNTAFLPIPLPGDDCINSGSCRGPEGAEVLLNGVWTDKDIVPLYDTNGPTGKLIFTPPDTWGNNPQATVDESVGTQMEYAMYQSTLASGGNLLPLITYPNDAPWPIPEEVVQKVLVERTSDWHTALAEAGVEVPAGDNGGYQPGPNPAAVLGGGGLVSVDGSLNGGGSTGGNGAGDPGADNPGTGGGGTVGGGDNPGNGQPANPEIVDWRIEMLTKFPRLYRVDWEAKDVDYCELQGAVIQHQGYPVTNLPPSGTTVFRGPVRGDKAVRLACHHSSLSEPLVVELRDNNTCCNNPGEVPVVDAPVDEPKPYQGFGFVIGEDGIIRFNNGGGVRLGSPAQTQRNGGGNRSPGVQKGKGIETQDSTQVLLPN